MKLVIFIVSVLLIQVSIAQADSLNIAFGKNRPPFVFKEQGSWQGIEVDIVREALHFSGHDIKHTWHVSNKRLIRVIRQLELDAVVGVKATDDKLYYSKVFIAHKNYAISRSLQSLQINSPKDLSRYSVTAWQNAETELGAEFAKAVDVKIMTDAGGVYSEYVDQKTQNILFWRKKTDVILIDREIFLWHKKQISEKYDTSFNLTYHDIFPDKNRYKVGFKSAALRDDFDQGLKYLYQSGQYQKIIDRYTN